MSGIHPKAARLQLDPWLYESLLQQILRRVPCIRSRPEGIARSRPLRVNRQRHSRRENLHEVSVPFVEALSHRHTRSEV